MNIHEYQAKGLLAKFGVGTLSGHVAYTADEAVEAAQKLGGADLFEGHRVVSSWGALRSEFRPNRAPNISAQRTASAWAQART